MTICRNIKPTPKQQAIFFLDPAQALQNLGAARVFFMYCLEFQEERANTKPQKATDGVFMTYDKEIYSARVKRLILARMALYGYIYKIY